jgi:plastocyanin
MRPMGGFRRIYLTGLAVLIGVLTGATATAQAADIIASPEGLKFEPGPYTQQQGETSSLMNQDASGPTSYHNVTARAQGPDGQPLFYSETILGGSSAPVEGTQYLAAGSYPFVCTLHAGMNGTLEVEATGTPAARPGVKLAVPKQKLKQVRRSGKLKVKLTPLAPSRGVAVEVRKGKKLLGLVPKVNLGTSAKTVKVKLTKSGRKAIKKGKKVKFSVVAQVPWGKTARTSRALR